MTSENNKASTYLTKLYTEVWQPFSLEKFNEYYDKKIVGQSGQVTLSFDEVYEHLRLCAEQYSHLKPVFHNIMAAGDGRILAWLSQTVMHHDGSQAYQINTMANYQLKNDKIIRVEFMWDKPIGLVMENLAGVEKPGLSIPKIPVQELLTRRELECFFHVIQGKTAKQIAQVLNLSPRTVESYLDNVKLKLTLNSIPQVMEYAVANGLVAVSPLLANALKVATVKVPKPDSKLPKSV